MSTDGVTIDPTDLEQLRSDVRKLRSHVDIVVVSHHNRDGGTPVQFATAATTRPRTSTPADRTKAEEYQKHLLALRSTPSLTSSSGHGTHTVQGVEVYQGKPILYAIEARENIQDNQRASSRTSRM
jgi:hypothetical protein